MQETMLDAPPSSPMPTRAQHLWLIRRFSDARFLMSRTEEYFALQEESIYRNADFLFAPLLVLQLTAHVILESHASTGWPWPSIHCSRMRHRSTFKTRADKLKGWSI
jgi:hypothetical protein